jgi:peptidoglycan/xylan/chitin deacetylase (PgdA/CDA1 family)
MMLSTRWERGAVRAIAGRRVGAVFVTTSWDDGHMRDHQLAGLLDTYGLPGTFYVAPRNVELRPRERLRERDLRALASDFEIGGHTLTHLRLATLPDSVARHEITDGKDALEQTIGMPLRSFCYPGGAYDERHRRMVEEAGFAVGRTVRRWVTAASSPFEMHTTVNAYRHLVDGPAALRLAAGQPAMARRLFWNWDLLAMTIFDQVVATGGVFHLWGHSWEIDANGDWDRLERVLSYISRRPGIEYVDNGELGARTAVT